MYKVETYRSKTGNTVFEHIINVLEPCSQSYASAVLLHDHLLKQDVDYLTIPEQRFKLIGFSRTFLNNVLVEHGDLQCTYCGKKGLVIEEQGMTVSRARMATVDHVIPISDGVDPFDTKNIVVACGICNGRKSNYTLSVFLKTAKGLRPNMQILSKFLTA